MIKRNILLNTDSYKHSHFLQYPPRSQRVFSYIESRGGEYPYLWYVGHQMFIKEYLSTPFTQEDIEEAAELIPLHGLPFNREGWEYILKEHNGYLPIRIHAVPEGTMVPDHNLLVSVENTDPMVPWLTSFVETALLRAIWYPTTVSTISKRIKNIIEDYLIQTGDPSLIDFKLHDFGARGVSSLESAGIGGLAHLIHFRGTDNIEALRYARHYYGENVAGFSIPAAEHSTITSWGEEHEQDAYLNMIKQFAGKDKIYAVVSDSYDIYEAVDKLWGGTLKKDVLEHGGCLVVRPDSGDPVTVILKCLQLLDKHYGYTLNVKGFKVLNPAVRIIQGDGVNEESIKAILNKVVEEGYSADNITFGMGGALLQHMNRDTSKFAMKASCIEVDYHYRDVFKNPKTDPGKSSKRGILDLFRNRESGEFKTINVTRCDPDISKWERMTQVVYEDGIFTQETLAVIRQRAARS